MRQKKLDEPPAAYLTRRVDQVCDRYEAAWKLAVGAGGRQPRMEEYLEGTSEPEHSALRHELEELASVYRQGFRSSRSGTPASDRPGEAKTDGAYSTGTPARSVRS